MAGEKLLQLIAQTGKGERARSDPTNLIFGTVTSIAPLTIQTEAKQPLDADFLVLSALCKPFSVPQLGQIWRGLAVGDRVRMLQCEGGQAFYVLEREGGL